MPAVSYTIHPDLAKARARVAALSRRPPDDPAYIEARDQLERARRTAEVAALENHVREIVSGAPPLTPEQRDRIATILHATPHKAGAA